MQEKERTRQVTKTERLRRGQMRAAAKWLQGLVGEDWGIRVLPADADKPRPVHANRNQRVESVINSRRNGQECGRVRNEFDDLMAASPWESVDKHRPSGIWLDRLSQKLIVRHFEGIPRHFRLGAEIIIKPETVYFTGKRSKRGETCLTLVMIDIDAHKRGDLQQAMRFANHLRKYFPACYIEVSTNGAGAHIFLIVDKTEWEDADYNAMLKEFDAWLKGILAETGIVLDTVEIKGHCATVGWMDGMPIHTAGILAKLPRDWERFEELKRSPVYTAHQLLAITKEHPIKAEHAPKVQRMRREGSVPFQGIEPERIDLWLAYAKRLLPADVHVGKSLNNRLVVTSEDMGITCALLEFIGKKMNSDGTLPWARTKGLWDCLYQRGVVSRSFNAKRFAWIRRFLNGAGLTDMQDPTYVIGERAAKWSPSERFWSIADSLDDNKERERQDFRETSFAISPLECWERGIPLVLVGITTKQTAERRRMDELVEAIIGSGWSKMAA